MRYILLFIVAALPVFIICWFIYLKDKNKEPTELLTKLFASGITSCFWVVLISTLMEVIFPFLKKDVEVMNIFESAFYAFIGVALVEECCKWFYVHKHGYKNSAFDEKYDIIVYAVFVSLGFAFFENILYVFGNNSIAVGITRALLAVPGHACDSIFMGYYLTLAKQAMIQGNTSLETTNKIKSIIVPTILHGFYDFCLFAKGDYFIIIFFVFVVFLYIFSLKKIKHLSETNSNYYQRTNSNILNGYGQNFQTIPQNYPVQTTSYQQAQVQHEYCTNCGAAMFGPFCAKCGKRK